MNFSGFAKGVCLCQAADIFAGCVRALVFGSRARAFFLCGVVNVCVVFVCARVCVCACPNDRKGSVFVGAVSFVFLHAHVRACACSQQLSKKSVD